MNPPNLKNLRFVSHLNLKNSGHRLDIGEMDWPGNPIDGKSILICTDTRKTKMGGWGKGKTLYHVEDEKNPGFRSLDELVKHYTQPIAVEPIKVRVKVKSKS